MSSFFETIILIISYYYKHYRGFVKNTYNSFRHNLLYIIGIICFTESGAVLDPINKNYQPNKIFCTKIRSVVCNNNKRIPWSRISPFYGNCDDQVLFIMKINVFIFPTSPIAQQSKFFVIEWMKRMSNAYLLWQLGHKRCSVVDLTSHVSVDIFVHPVIRKK